MPLFETFAKRMRRARGEAPDVFVYDQIPVPLRVQVVQIMHGTLGNEREYYDGWGVNQEIEDAYGSISHILRRELGVFRLVADQDDQIEYLNEITRYILSEKNAEAWLSAVELVCRTIEMIASNPRYRGFPDAPERATDAVDEINGRFREHGLGYEYNGEIIRIDSEFVHSEAVKPTLQILNGRNFEGAQREFLSGYEHYRNGKNREALADALKALESTLKSIFDRRGWAHDPERDNCKKLVQIAIDQQLIPQFWQAHFSGLRTMLEAGVPTVRNRLGGHGDGPKPKEVPPHIVAYALHMTAATIQFLAKSDDALR